MYTTGHDMTYDWLIQLTNKIQTVIAPAMYGPPPEALALVAGYILFCLTLFWFTRGKEFLIAGYSAVLFLVPFIQFA